MQVTYDDCTRSRPERGPELYYGYCTRTRRYRMMDLPDYLSNLQQGMTRWMTDPASMYQEIARGYSMPGSGSSVPGMGQRRGVRAYSDHDCGCRGRAGCDCHCECCVCDADVLVHARCGELRRIPVTFDNDTRRERQVKLELEKFVTAGGKDLGWNAQLSQSEFALRGCDEHTVTLTVQVRCETGDTQPTPDRPPGVANTGAANAADRRQGTVDRCEVGYATLRAEGCLVRPVVIAVAVLPDDCDAYRRPCSCGCCH